MWQFWTLIGVIGFAGLCLACSDYGKHRRY